MIGQLRGFPDRLVNDRVERNDPADELPSQPLNVVEIGSGNRQGAGKSTGNGREQHRQSPRGVAEIGGSEYHYDRNDAGDYLAPSTDRNQESGICIHPPVVPSRSPATSAAV